MSEKAGKHRKMYFSVFKIALFVFAIILDVRNISEAIVAATNNKLL